MNKKLIRILPFACLLVVILVPEFVSRADAAPPLKAPGSNIAPGEQTMVQMLSENVLVLIRKNDTGEYYASISAEFLMENRGEVDESMRVRFPMEDVNEPGDNRGGRPTVRNFAVQLDGQFLQSQTIQEPFQEGGVVVTWSTFPVQFLAGKKQYIRISYDTDLGLNKYKWNNYLKVDYILETGSGWYGPIGQAVITLRLPFEASETTVLQTDSRSVTFVGHEARYVFNNLEPATNDNIQFLFVDPAVWADVLDLELRTGEYPRDIASVVRLADLYLTLATECPPRGNRFINEHTQYLAESIVAQGLFYSPDDPDLLAERAKTDYHRYICGEIRSWDSPQVQDIYRELDFVFSLDPDNPIALEVKSELDFSKQSNPSLSPTDETPITPSWTRAVLTPTINITPENSPVRIVPSDTTVEGWLTSSPTASNGIQPAAILLGILLFLGGAAVGVLFYRTWSLSHAAQTGSSKR